MWSRENDFDAVIASAASANAVPVALIKAIIGAESAFNPNAASSSSYGLMQLYPPTANTIRPGTTQAQLLDPAINIHVGAAYVRRLLNQFGDDIEAVISAYNAGPGNAKRATADGRFCMEWKVNPKPANATLDRDCKQIVTVKAGTFPNQAYVNKVLSNLTYFNQFGDVTGGSSSAPITSPLNDVLGDVDPKVIALGIGLLITLLRLRR